MDQKRDDRTPPPPTHTSVKGVGRQQDSGDVLNRSRSRMLQVEDTKLVGAKGLTISTALDCSHY